MKAEVAAGHPSHRKRSGWTCWCTASPERNDMVQYFAELSRRVSSPPATVGCNPMAPGACARRSSTATSSARSR